MTQNHTIPLTGEDWCLNRSSHFAIPQGSCVCEQRKKNFLNLDFLHKPSQMRRKVLMRGVVWRIPLLVPAEASGLWQRNISGEESRKGRRLRLARLQPAFIYPRISATRWGRRVILVWRFHKGSRPGDVDTALRGCQRRGTYCPSLTALAGCGERGMKGRSVHWI